MPVLEMTDKIAPKSIIRHRPIGERMLPWGKRSSVVTTTPIPQRASRPSAGENSSDVAEWRRDADTTSKQTSIRGCRSIVPLDPIPQTLKRRTTLTRKGSGAREYAWYRLHPLGYLGIGMIAMLTLWIVLQTVFGWVGIMLDDLRYGRPRTFHVDAWVGHNEQTGVASHFIAINLNRRIEIIELPGGDASRARIYVGPQLYGANDDLVPVTLRFIDINKDRKPEMIVNFRGSHAVFINEKGSFRPPLPTEHSLIEQFLAQIKS